MYAIAVSSLWRLCKALLGSGTNNVCRQNLYESVLRLTVAVIRWSIYPSSGPVSSEYRQGALLLTTQHQSSPLQ